MWPGDEGSSCTGFVRAMRIEDGDAVRQPAVSQILNDIFFVVCLTKIQLHLVFVTPLPPTTHHTSHSCLTIIQLHLVFVTPLYCNDKGQLYWKALMGRGMSSNQNQIVQEETMTLIKEMAMRSTIAGHATGSITSAVGKAKKVATNGIGDLKGLGEEAQKKGTALAGAATRAKVMG